ncbi:RAMP superfamily CRISPR-associated protein [Desulfatirhabdium butyrativorans]|uniref:RAMP superfamily CRISPR-associated protein n=1 Tax=Desulfatirhabdium butyrativorans TaxID=340467 RepID=UPI0003F8F432|nr:RAMP superfamily CRISPR-associated protein [Desulfatirhabdium butyrativorans]
MTHHLHLELEIRFKAGWHTGSGEGGFTIDNLVRRNSRGKPFIPASTLKGVIRQSCERLNRTLGFPEPWQVHNPTLSGAYDYRPLCEMPSPVEQIFGTHYGCGELYFRDAVTAVDDRLKPFPRSHVARFRLLRTARDQHLYSTEYSPATTLNTTIDGWHERLPSLSPTDPPYAYCLLIAGILAVDRIGGRKSTGAGWIEGGIGIRKALYKGAALDIGEAFELLDAEFYRDSMEGV